METGKWFTLKDWVNGFLQKHDFELRRDAQLSLAGVSDSHFRFSQPNCSARSCDLLTEIFALR